jgi:hypothetical protein
MLFRFLLNFCVAFFVLKFWGILDVGFLCGGDVDSNCSDQGRLKAEQLLK